MNLIIISSFEGGDHKGFFYDVIVYKNLNTGNVLMLDTLRDK